MSESDYDKKLKRFLLPILRRKSLWWTARNEAKAAARIEHGLYRCGSCKGSFSRSQIEMDHIKPVVNVKTGWTNWDDFIKSLYCDKDNFAALCKNCHSVKSQIENAQRVINKKAKKIQKKSK